MAEISELNVVDNNTTYSYTYVNFFNECHKSTYSNNKINFAIMEDLIPMRINSLAGVNYMNSDWLNPVTGYRTGPILVTINNKMIPYAKSSLTFNTNTMTCKPIIDNFNTAKVQFNISSSTAAIITTHGWIKYGPYKAILSDCSLYSKGLPTLYDTFYSSAHPEGKSIATATVNLDLEYHYMHCWHSRDPYDATYNFYSLWQGIKTGSGGNVSSHKVIFIFPGNATLPLQTDECINFHLENNSYNVYSQYIIDNDIYHNIPLPPYIIRKKSNANAPTLYIWYMGYSTSFDNNAIKTFNLPITSASAALAKYINNIYFGLQDTFNSYFNIVRGSNNTTLVTYQYAITVCESGYAIPYLHELNSVSVSFSFPSSNYSFIQNNFITNGTAYLVRSGTTTNTNRISKPTDISQYDWDRLFRDQTIRYITFAYKITGNDSTYSQTNKNIIYFSTYEIQNRVITPTRHGITWQ